MAAREGSILSLNGRPRTLLVAVAWLLGSVSAKARPPDVHLVWQRPVASQCPTREALQADVEALLGRRVFTSREQEARVTVRGAIEEATDGVRVHLEALGEHGEALGKRELTAPAGGCAELRDAIALVLTLFVEYEPETDSELDAVFGFGGRLSLARAPMPRFALAVGPAVFLELGRIVQLYASAAYWPAVSIATTGGVGAKLEALSVGLRACARLWAGFGLCAGSDNGVLVATPLQLRGPKRQTRLLSHGALEVGWEVALDEAVRLELAGGALLSFSRPELSYLRADGERVFVHRPAAAGAIFAVTLIIAAD